VGAEHRSRHADVLKNAVPPHRLRGRCEGRAGLWLVPALLIIGATGVALLDGPAATMSATAAQADIPVAVDTVPGSAALASDSASPAPRGQQPVRPAPSRGIYLNAWAAGSTRKLARLIDLAHRTEINTFVIDVKEVGEISYTSRVPLAVDVAASRRYIRDPAGVLDRVTAAGVHPVARIVVFRDTILARARPDLAVQHENGGIWTDRHGKPWVDTYNRDVWDYNIAIAREAVELGFREIQWDYVRFPDSPASWLATAVWPAQEGRTRAQGVREFLLYAREQLSDLDVPITADVFGLTTSAADDMGIGQNWESMADAVDVLLPMVYPSHYAPGSYGLESPNAEPYAVVRRALGDAVARSSEIPCAAAIQPWLQAFTLGPPRYTSAHIREQVRAVQDAGLQEWVLWHPGSDYPEAAFEPAGKPPASRDTVLPPDTTAHDGVPPGAQDSFSSRRAPACETGVPERSGGPV
jgi:hypothetical protein